jgi:hypothetical protein
MKLSDIQAPNDNSSSIELQAISSINNNAVEPTKRAFSLEELSSTKSSAKSSTKIELTKRVLSLEEPSSTKIAKLAESIEKTPKDITLEEGSAALVEAIGCCTGIFMFLKRIFTHDIPNPSDDCFVDSSDFFINLDGAFSSPGVVNPGYIDHQDAISLAGAEVQS